MAQEGVGGMINTALFGWPACESELAPDQKERLSKLREEHGPDVPWQAAMVKIVKPVDVTDEEKAHATTLEPLAAALLPHDLLEGKPETTADELRT